MQPLFAVLQIADFATAVLTRGGRQPGAVAVITGEAPNQFVFSANEPARKGRIHEGMPLAEARSRFNFHGGGALTVLERDPEAEQRSQKQLLDLAQSATPRFEDSAPGLILLDFTGLREPHASAAQLLHGTQHLGFAPNIAVSQNRFVALCATRTHSGLTHIYPGQEAGFLTVQPLDVLPLDEPERETLARWGIRTVGELAKLSEDDLVERFGERGARMARLARGEETSLLKAHETPPELEEKQDFDWEVGEIEPLSFALSGMLEKLSFKLESHSLAVAKLKTVLKLANGDSFERTLELSYPLTDPRTLLTLARLDLSAHPPPAAIVGAAVAVVPTERRRTQFSLFAPDLPSPEKLAVTLARLSGLVGQERVGTPVAPDTHRPGAATVATFVTKTHASAWEPTRQALGPAPRPMFRCFRPPWTAKVISRGETPVYLDTEPASGPITTRSGPWRVCGEWWTDEPWQYQEWDVEVEGRLYRICYELSTGKWCVTGAYD